MQLISSMSQAENICRTHLYECTDHQVKVFGTLGTLQIFAVQYVLTYLCRGHVLWNDGRSTIEQPNVIRFNMGLG